MRRMVIIPLAIVLFSVFSASPAMSRGRGYYHTGYRYRPYYAWPYGYYRPWPVFGFYYTSPVTYSTWPPAPVAWVDTDVSPEEAEVWVDGLYAGEADKFDGFPGYLTLSPGTHTIEFRHEGRRTEAQEIFVRAGSYLRFDFKMARADNKSPSSQVDTAELSPQKTESGAAPGLMRLDVTPEDSSIYIDSELYGSASMLAGLHGDLRLAAGEHLIEIVRPGYLSARREVHLQPGNRVVLSLSLERAD